MEREFQVKINFAVFLFLGVYLVYGVYYAVTVGLYEASLILATGALFAIYFLGFRPYKYKIDKRTVYKYFRLRKPKELDLMDCETICDPVPRFSEIYSRAHAIEIYTTAKKRHCFFPKDRVGFVEMVMRGNKRIHCTVQDYTDVHRKVEKRQRKERKRAERAASQRESK